MNILDLKRKLLPLSGYQMDGGGGGGGQPTQSNVYQTNIPDYAQPYVETMLGTAQQEIFNYAPDGSGNMVPTTMKGYRPFNQDPSEYFAPATKLQTDARAAAGNMGVAAETGQAANMARQAGMAGLGTNYQAGRFGNQFQAPEQYQPGQFSMGEARAPALQNYQFENAPADVRAQNYDAPAMQGQQTGYNPNLQNFQMDPAERVNTESFNQPGSAQAYMNPYMQSVVDLQQQDAQRQADIARTGRNAQAVGAGAFGGSRQAIMDAEAAKNLAAQKGAIQAQGLQSAYGQAQQQFNAEQQARLQAQQANQQAGLTTGSQNLAANLGIQQLGTQTGLQTALANLNNQQQAAVQNQAAQLQTQGLNAQQAMQAALANQQMGYNVGSQNLAANLGIQQLGAGQSMQAQLANQQALQQAQNAAEQSRQFGAGQGMTAAQQRAQFGLAGQQAGEQSRQYGAGLQMQGLQNALGAAGQLGQIGQNVYGQQVGNINLQNQMGAQQQQEQQAIKNQQIQNYATAQQYPMMQLGNMSNLLRGLPMQSTTVQGYQAAPSPISQLGGLGLTAAGIAGMSGIGKAKGGRIKEKKRPAGLAELALSRMA